ncbi:GNAT family N-acetyltransferase [Taklimakanibacter deserti]|uniref:GNAT family N-acetyltransferase n=1 Tax=Taklimakanibacter deserti TaxID=2267839 RepID=UPI000E64F398
MKPPDRADLALVAIDFRTLFVPGAPGRILRENDPDRSAGPLFWLGGSAQGNVAGVHQDVDDAVAAELLALSRSEPPFHVPATLPLHIGRYERLLARDGAVPRRDLEVTYELPRNLPVTGDDELVSSGSAAALRFEAAIAEGGMPENLVVLKMREVGDLWPPWCMLLCQGEVASIAFAARLSGEGAELGLATVPKFRGRGFAALATAAWSNHPALASRALFYSAAQDNKASRRVIERLNLRRIGTSLRLDV